MELAYTKSLSVLSRRPAVGAAAALMAGILLHRLVPDWPWLWLAAAGGLAGLALGSLRFQIVSTVSLAMGIIFAGLAVAQLRRSHFAPDHIAAFTDGEPRNAEVELVISQPPRTIARPARFSSGTEERQIAWAEIAAVRTNSGWQEASGQVTLSISSPVAGLAFGQRVRVFGSLNRPAAAMNPGQFDWLRYYREQRVLAAMHADAGNVRVLSPAKFSILQWLRATARDALARGFDPKRDIDHALLRALALGDYDPQLRAVQDDFQRTGTSHHLAISGLHVAILGGVVFFLCRLVRLSPRTSAWTMMGFVLLYGLVALPSPPVVRSILLCLCFGTGVLLKRSVDGVQLLAMTVIAMLVYDPLDLYNPGFQLSFGTVLGLMIFATPLAHALHEPSEDERVLRSFGIEPARAAGLWRWFRDSAVVTIAAGMVAWAISAPLIVQHFDQLNPWAIPASILLAPAVFLSLVGALVKIVLTLLIPWGASWWAGLAALPVANMRWTVGQLARIPGSDVPLPALSNAVIVLYYAIIALPMLPVSRDWMRRAFKGGAATAAITLLFLPALIGFAPRRGGDLTMTLLSVGPGQCAVVQLPGGRTILVDAGSASAPDLARRTVAPFLRRQGISRIDAIFISHPNADHFNAAAEIARETGLVEVYLSPHFGEHAKKIASARMFLREMEELGCSIRVLQAGQSLALDEASALEVLWPPRETALDANESSLVLKLNCRGRSILFPGDVQRLAQTVMLQESHGLLGCDVLVAPHHGSGDETTQRLLAATNPRHVLASSDRRLSAKQMQFDQFASPMPVLRTGTKGAITVRIDKGGGIGVSSFLQSGP